MNNRPKSTNQLLLFLMPLLLGAGIRSLNLLPHRFAILPAGDTAKKDSASDSLIPADPADLNESDTADSTEAAEHNPAEDSAAAAGQENTEKAATGPPAAEVVLEAPPNILPVIRYNRK